MRILSAVAAVAVLVWCLARLSTGIRYLVSERGPQGLRRLLRRLLHRSRMTARAVVGLVLRGLAGVVRLVRRCRAGRGGRSRPWLWPSKPLRVRAPASRLHPVRPLSSGVTPRIRKR